MEAAVSLGADTAELATGVIGGVTAGVTGVGGATWPLSAKGGGGGRPVRNLWDDWYEGGESLLTEQAYVVRGVELLTLRVILALLPQVERGQTILNTETAVPLLLLTKALTRCRLGHEACVWGLNLCSVCGLLGREGALLLGANLAG